MSMYETNKEKNKDIKSLFGNISRLDLIKGAFPLYGYPAKRSYELLTELFQECFSNAVSAIKGKDIKTRKEIVNSFKENPDISQRLEEAGFLSLVGDVAIRGTAAGIETVGVIRSKNKAVEAVKILERYGWSSEKIQAARSLTDIKVFAKTITRACKDTSAKPLAIVLMASLVSLSVPNVSDAFINTAKIHEVVKQEIKDSISNAWGDIINIPDATKPDIDAVYGTKIDDAVLDALLDPMIDYVNDTINEIENTDEKAIESVMEAVKLFEAEITLQNNLKKLEENPGNENLKKKTIDSFTEFFKLFPKKNSICETACLGITLNEIVEKEENNRDKYLKALTSIDSKVKMESLKTFDFSDYTSQFGAIYGVDVKFAIEKACNTLTMVNGYSMEIG